jgi:predicted DNA-binding transcriptional regulator YafY
MQGWNSAASAHNKTYREHREKIDQLARAIWRKRTVEIRYYAATRDRSTRRKVDPYHIWFANGALY